MNSPTTTSSPPAMSSPSPPSLESSLPALANNPPVADSSSPHAPQPTSPVQRLRWDFRTTFPSPTPQAIDAGVIADEDAQPENLPAIHDEHAREMRAVLHDLDAVLDARRSGVDPMTKKPPRTPAAKERLEKLFATEPDRLQRWWTTLLDTYESVFGADAADAFGKAVRAWHAGIEVVTDSQEKKSPAVATPMTSEPNSNTRDPQNPSKASSIRRQRDTRRVVARLPVPKPLPAAVAAGHFGQDGDAPIRPRSDEVYAITEQHAEKLIDLLDSVAVQRPGAEQDRLLQEFDSAVKAYAEDFGEPAARQLDAYVRRQAKVRTSPAGQGRHR
jgi:hypothetical protein